MCSLAGRCTPEQAGIARVTIDKLKGGDPAHNAQAIRDVLDGARNPFRDIVLMNAGAALMVAGRAQEIGEGVGKAALAIDTGAAKLALEKLIALTKDAAP